MHQGILVIWKEKGMTSHDVVFKLRKILKMKKIGHTGTLDPQVEGILVLCLGKATKVVQLLTDSSKEYLGQITLGIATETEDAYGQIIKQEFIKAPLDTDVIDEMMASFVGEIKQIPPMYSAVKVNGKRLYEYARQGLEVERPERTAQIYRLERLNQPVYNDKAGTITWNFKVKCGKGTYIRTLAVDMGVALGYPAHMSQLVRTASGDYRQEDAWTLEEIQNLMENDHLEAAILPLETALKNLKSINISDSDYDKIKNGQVLAANYFNQEIDEATVLYYQQRALAIYQQHPHKSGLIKPQIMFE